MQYSLATSKSFNDITTPDSFSPNDTIKRRLQFPARVEFCPSNGGHSLLYGAVNCLTQHTELIRKDEGLYVDQNKALLRSIKLDATQPASNRKLGPVLLEIRQLVLINPMAGIGKESESSSNNSKYARGYSDRVIAVSRGIVSSSVSSTCLTFRRDNHWRNDPSVDLADVDELQCATGQSSGVLCVHTFKNLNSYLQDGSAVLDSASSDDSVVSYYQYHQRTNRPVSAVSWRNGAGADYSRHVALGLMGLNSPEKTVPSNIVTSGGGAGNLDREYCCMVWDIEGQSGTKGTKQSPLFRLAHNIGVSSLSWVEGGQLLAVGTQGKIIQLYDLRASGTNAPPISIQAHRDIVSGIEVDPTRPSIFASFSRTFGEPVRLWDVRKPDTFLSEIKINFASSTVSGSPVAAISWVPQAPGSLCIAAGEILRYFDTRTNVSKPLLTTITHMTGSIQSMAFRTKDTHQTPSKISDDVTATSRTGISSFERMIVVNMDGVVKDLPVEQSSPLSISHRDGRIAHACGLVTWISPPTNGKSLFSNSINTPVCLVTNEIISTKDGTSSFACDDISVVMNRRTTNINNLKSAINGSRGMLCMLPDEDYCTSRVHSSFRTKRNSQLKNLWDFFDRIENLISYEWGSIEETSIWQGRTLINSGITRLLSKDEIKDPTSKQKGWYKKFDSPGRRAILEACGWSTKDRDEVNFERKAALAVWHGNIEEAVEILSDGSAHIRHLVQSGTGNDMTRPSKLSTSSYAEALDLLSVCVAGYNVEAVHNLPWTQACQRLSKRDEFNDPDDTIHSPYIRALCTFLVQSSDSDNRMILSDDTLSLIDRIAFACSFLDVTTINHFLNSSLDNCFHDGNLEGLIITGLDKTGFALLQAYLDKTADVQTVAIISSLVLLPNDWVFERSLCNEWIESYRDLLNIWQMWQYRAKFDVSRAERMRKLKRFVEDYANNVSGSRSNAHSSRRSSVNHTPARKAVNINTNKQMDDATAFPPQLHARCNYCNTSLPLMMMRRNEAAAKQWLSRQKPNANEQKPILSCCPNPQCRKPLPRCAVCLLPLGCLNPYLEMKRIGRTGLTGGDDFSDLANLPFAEWFTWCMKCKHGGHAHHIVGWFANHGDTCPVSGCNCHCQSDAIQKLPRLGSKR